MRAKGFRMHIPRPPLPVETGNRVGWTQMDPQTMRSHMMLPMAIRLGLEPPVEPPGKWFPANWTKGQVTYKCSVQKYHSPLPQRATVQSLTAWEYHHVYIGNGSARMRWPASQWAVPRHLQQQGMGQEVRQQYKQWLWTQPRLWQALSTLVGKNTGVPLCC